MSSMRTAPPAAARTLEAVSLSIEVGKGRRVQLSKDQFAVLSELLDEGLDLPEASPWSVA